jgi:UMF1 family MFS transporter
MVNGQAYWGWAISISGLCIAFSGPFLGNLADKKNLNSIILKTSTYLCILFTAALWFAKPSTEYILFTLIIVCLANYFYELSSIFYNSLLIHSADKQHVGKVSGFAFALGYLGGIITLILTIILLIQSNYLIDLDQKINFRSTAIFVALWFLIFSYPLLSQTKYKKVEPNKKKSNSLKKILWNNGLTNTTRFLFARLLYADGLNTIFVMGGIFAVGVFKLSINELLMMSVLMNVAALIGASFGGYFNDKYNSKKTISFSLICLIFFSILIIFTQSKISFFIFSFFLGLFIGPIQSASRVMITKLTKIEDQNKAFGLFATSGKLTSFFGPFLVGTITFITENQRIGFASVLLLLFFGWIILHRTKGLK